MRYAHSLRALAIAAALLVPAAGAQAASIWTPVNSGTTDDISAVVYQSPTRFWYATTSGRIAYWNGTTFVAATAASGSLVGEQFTDLAFQPTSVAGGPGTSGLYGYAVASNGDVWQSSDGGATWRPMVHPTTFADCGSSTSPPEPPIAENELNAVVWAGSTTAYLLGNDSTVLRSLAANTGAPAFQEINKNNTGTCQSQSQPYKENLTDAAFFPGNPSVGYMIAQYFGQLYSTSTDFSSGTPLKELINEYTGNPHIAMDPAKPNLLWAVDHAAGGADCGTLCFAYSTDGGHTFNNPKYPQVDTGGQQRPPLGLYDVSSQGGVEVAVGTGGTLLNSVDGVSFYNQPADGALATENWRAEDAFDSTHAAAGGVGGALVVTASANSIPDITPPTATISGPTSVTSGQNVTYTAVVSDNAGGSGPNPASYTWTAAGFPAQHGATATYNFPRGIGYVTIKLDYADNAGNQGQTASLTVYVKDAPVTTPPAPSGSSPKTTSTGGGTVTIFRVVTVTGRKGRFVPVVVSSKSGRKFVVTILTVKGHHHVAVAYKTLRHGGKATVHVALASSVKPGNYLVVVRVFTLKGHGIGRQIKLAFILV